MSTSNAMQTPRRRARAPDKEEGFDTLAQILTQSFYSQFGVKYKKKSGLSLVSPSPHTGNGGAAALSPGPSTVSVSGSVDSKAKLAYKSLSTSFAGPPLNYSKTPNKDNATAIVTPSTMSSTHTHTSTVNTRATRSTASSITSDSNPTSSSTADIDLFYDQRPVVRVSSLNRGVKRLKYPDIVRMSKGQEFILVIPHSDRKQLPAAVELRKEVLNEFKKIIWKVGGAQLTRDQKNDFWTDELAKHTFEREGKELYEFNVKIVNYAERPELKLKGLDLSIVHELINNNRGIVLEVVEYGRSSTFRLKFKALPFIEVFRLHEEDEPFLDPTVECPKSSSESVMLDHMAKEFHHAKGDPCRYVKILMRCYQRAYKNEKMKNKGKLVPSPPNKSETIHMKQTKEDLKCELNNEALVKFATMVDQEYYKAMKKVSSDWTSPCTTLISDSLTAKFYKDMQRLFPLLHFALSTMINSRYYTVERYVNLIEA